MIDMKMKEKFLAWLDGMDEDIEDDVSVDAEGEALDDAAKIESEEGEPDEAENLEEIKSGYEERIANLEQELEKVKDKAWSLYTKVNGKDSETPEKENVEQDVEKEDKKTLDDMIVNK